MSRSLRIVPHAVSVALVLASAGCSGSSDDGSGNACEAGRSALGDVCLPVAVISGADRAIVHPEVGVLVVPDEVVVYLQSTASSDAVVAEIEAAGGQVLAFDADVARLTARIPGGSLASTGPLRDVLAALPAVKVASLNWVASPMVVPDDPGWSGETWDEASPGGANWYLEMIRAPSAWDRFTGPASPRFRVGVIDWGIPTHADLTASLVAVCPTTDATCTGSLSPTGHATTVEQHGAAVSGLIAATGNNAIGLTGLLWNADIYYCQTDGAQTRLGACLGWLVDNQARVINYSSGYRLRPSCAAGTWPCPFPGGVAPWQDPAQIAAHQTRVSAMEAEFTPRLGSEWLFVQSAGNEALEQGEYGANSMAFAAPARDRVLVVGAVGPTGDLSPFSNYGALDLVAPGGDGSGTAANEILCLEGDAGTQSIAGTSFSAPLVAGVAALAWSRVPGAAAADVRADLLAAAEASGKTATVGAQSWPVADAAGVAERVEARCDQALQAGESCGEAEPEPPPSGGDEKVCEGDFGPEGLAAGCTHITGDLDLAFLGEIRGVAPLHTVDGSVEITFNALSDLTVLSNLARVGGDVDISQNPELTDLRGLEALTEVGGSIEIGVNEKLQSTAALANVRSVGQQLYVYGNRNLAALDGFNGLDRLGSLRVTLNPELTSLAGLERLRETLYGLEISSLESLAELGLPALRRVGGDLAIRRNRSLPQCQVDRVVEALESVGGSADTSGNLEGGECP